jgi:hypothetical protein
VPEPWNSSSNKAHELSLSEWGTPDEVAVIAAPVRYAANRKEATDILKELARQSPFISRSGLEARLQRRSVGKLVSSTAVHSSFSPDAHYLAAANVDRLFANAIEPWQFSLNPNKNNEGLKARRYLYAPLAYEGRIIIIKITVKEYLAADTKLYSIEAIDIEQ